MNPKFLGLLGIVPRQQSVSAPRSRTPDFPLPEGPRQRAAERERDKTLAPEAVAWLNRLPRHRRPESLSKLYPRICNRLALLWPDRTLTEHYFNELLVTRRTGRAGFPPSVATDLVSLHDYYVRTTSAEAVKAWDDRTLAVGDR